MLADQMVKWHDLVEIERIGTAPDHRPAVPSCAAPADARLKLDGITVRQSLNESSATRSRE